VTREKPYRSRYVVVPAVRGMRKTVYGVRTHFIEAGQGEAVILLHGGSAGSTGELAWSETVPGLASRYRVIALDMLSFGYSDKPLIDYSMQTLVEHLAGFIDTMGFERVYLIGQSTGAHVAAKYSCDFPERVIGTVMVNTNTLTKAMGLELGADTEGQRARKEDDGSREALVRLMKAIVHRQEHVDEEMLQTKLALAELPGMKEARRSLDYYKANVQHDPNQWQVYSMQHRLPKLTVPLCLIWGTEDRHATIDRGRLLHQALPNAEYYEIEEASHHCFVDQPERFNELVFDFFQRAAEQSSPSLATVAP
jgi:pimeloyl-ACP methyl ester carboxylesterase